MDVYIYIYIYIGSQSKKNCCILILSYRENHYNLQHIRSKVLKIKNNLLMHMLYLFTAVYKIIFNTPPQKVSVFIGLSNPLEHFAAAVVIGLDLPYLLF